MSVKDVIKSSIYESFGKGTGISFSQIILIIVISALIGTYVYFVYKNFARSQFYSKDLNITLVGMTIIVAAIMVAMQSNLLVSLGMVGALSIVRFRTAVKSPIDLLYLFWSISLGIIVGVGLFALAAVVCLVMTLALWVFGRMPATQAPGLLVITSDAGGENEKTIEKILDETTKYYKQKSVSAMNDSCEYIYEVNAKDRGVLVEKLNTLNEVKKVNYLEHKGEFRG